MIGSERFVLLTRKAESETKKHQGVKLAEFAEKIDLSGLSKAEIFVVGYITREITNTEGK